MEDAHKCIMTLFGEEMEAKTILNTARTSSPLGGVALGNVGFDQPAHLSLLIESHFAMFA